MPIPREFWKVVALPTREGALLACAYLASQEGWSEHRFEEYPGRLPHLPDFGPPASKELTKLQFSDNVRQADVALQSSPGNRELNWLDDVRLR